MQYYQTQVRRLLQNPSAPVALYSDTDINSWINTARGQLAGEAECVRYLATLTTTAGVNNYAFSSLNTGVAATTGISGVINVRSVMYAVGQGYQWVTPRPWPWFQLYHMNNPVPLSAAPLVWSQFAQGGAATPAASTAGALSSSGGSFYIDPPPDIAYTLLLDCVCYPIALTSDTTVEAIPYLWTDTVPFFAAWFALLSAQMQARRADAEAYFNYYQTFLQRARQFANPSVNRYMYEQAEDPARLNKLGITQKAG